MRARVAAFPELTRVLCHGECHGANNVMIADSDSGWTPAFFDFDDAGYGYLAYDLSVYLWTKLLGQTSAIEGERRVLWQAFLSGYQSVQKVADHDLAAVASFVCIRHIWLMGEYASRQQIWGQLGASWLTKQIDCLKVWETLPTP